MDSDRPDLRPELRMSDEELERAVEKFTEDGPSDCLCPEYGHGMLLTRVNVPYCPIHGDAATGEQT